MRVTVFPGSRPWSYALRGAVAVLFGLIMLGNPAIGLAAFIFAYGVFSLADGIVAIAASFIAVEGRRVAWALLFGGLASAAIGLFCLFRPGISLLVMSVIAASWFLITGIGTVWSAIEYRKQIRGDWILVIVGALALAFGLYLLIRPIIAAALLPIMIGSYVLAWGIFMLFAAFRLWRSYGHGSSSSAE